MVTKRGEERAVLIPVAEWRRLTETKRPSLKELLLTDFARGALNIPPRGKAQRRPNPFVER
jgi:hypothetical protein